MTIKPDTSQTTLDEAWAAGVAARRRGIPIKDCPHKAESPFNNPWRGGWMAEDRDAKTNQTPEKVIRRIAEVANAVALQAGVGGVETAGALVSALAAHPEKIAPFLSGELDLIDDETLLRPEMGCLTWHAMNGRIVSPAMARAAKQKHDH